MGGGPPHWGKDFGYDVPRPGSLSTATTRWRSGASWRGSRSGRSATWPPGSFRPTAARGGGRGAGSRGPAAGAVPGELPRLGVDRAGRLFLAYRRAVPEAQSPLGTSWFWYVTAYAGNAWTAPVLLPDSDGLLDNRPALATGAPGGPLYLIHSSDGRSRVPAAEIAAGSTRPRSTGARPPRRPGWRPRRRLDPAARTRSSRMNGPTWRGCAGCGSRPAARTTSRCAASSTATPRSPPTATGRPARGHLALRPRRRPARLDRQRRPRQRRRPEYTWWLIQKTDRRLPPRRRFAPDVTYERSVRYPDGHRNVMFAQRGIRPLPRLASSQARRRTARRPTPRCSTRYLEALRRHLRLAHHGTDMGTDWRDNDPRSSRSSRSSRGTARTTSTWAPRAAPSERTQIGGYQPAGFIWNALAKGYRLASSARATTSAPTSATPSCWPRTPTRAAILDAFKKRHCYARHRQHRPRRPQRRAPDGRRVRDERRPRLAVAAIGDGADGAGGGREGQHGGLHGGAGEGGVDLEWMDATRRPGSHYYYVRVEQADGHSPGPPHVDPPPALAAWLRRRRLEQRPQRSECWARGFRSSPRSCSSPVQARHTPRPARVMPTISAAAHACTSLPCVRRTTTPPISARNPAAANAPPAAIAAASLPARAAFSPSSAFARASSWLARGADLRLQAHQQAQGSPPPSARPGALGTTGSGSAAAAACAGEAAGCRRSSVVEYPSDGWPVVSGCRSCRGIPCSARASGVTATASSAGTMREPKLPGVDLGEFRRQRRGSGRRSRPTAGERRANRPAPYADPTLLFPR